jgi:aspartate aminotransferase
VAHDYGYPEEGIIITYGASQALYNIFDSTIGDEDVLIPAPFWFAFPNIEHYLGCRTEDGKLIRSDVDLVDYLLQDANVATVAGSLCGTPGYLRITYAIAEELFEKAIQQIKESLGELRVAVHEKVERA